MDTHPHLQALAARPRPVGSEANAEARAYCAGHLRSLGFEVAERPFAFSALPGKHAAQIIGLVAVVGCGVSLLTNVPASGPITILTIILVAAWLGGKNATRGPWLRATGINLEATRGSAPKVWLIAHVDSKSQPISSAMRTVAATLLVVGMLGWLVFPNYWFPLSRELGMVGGVGLLLAAVGSKSDGAADNASGVAAVLDGVALLSPTLEVGVLISDAEELALAGAAAWAHGREPKFAVNCDTIDDVGALVSFRYGYRQHALDEAVAKVVTAVDPRARIMRPPFGVLTDSNAFHRAGWPTVTLARGTLRTLNRIHTTRDSLDFMRGTGIPDAAHVLARLVEELA